MTGAPLTRYELRFDFNGASGMPDVYRLRARFENVITELAHALNQPLAFHRHEPVRFGGMTTVIETTQHMRDVLAQIDKITAITVVETPTVPLEKSRTERAHKPKF